MQLRWRWGISPRRVTLTLASVLLLVGVLDGAPLRAERPWTLSSDSLVYTDTDNVEVLSSQLAVERALDDDGGKAQASAVVDVISAASVDVVSQASKRFSEVREEGNLALSHGFGDVLASLNYRGSTEPDYLSHGFGTGFQARLGSPDSTLSSHYQVTFDTVGRHGTPYSVWSRPLTSHAVDLSFTQNLDRQTVLRGVYSLTVQDGYMEKPYRFVPLFDASGLTRARTDGVVLGLDTFDRYRLASRPSEEVPDLRIRHALAVRGLRYLDPLHTSLRLDYRFYFDDWGMRAHTAELALVDELSSHWLFSVFTRGYTQNAASFYRRVYLVSAADEIPRFRTVDRKLSPYHALTGGVRGTLRLSSVTVYLELSAMHTWFTDYLYLSRELALVSQAGVAWTF